MWFSVRVQGQDRNVKTKETWQEFLLPRWKKRQWTEATRDSRRGAFARDNIAEIAKVRCKIVATLDHAADRILTEIVDPMSLSGPALAMKTLENCNVFPKELSVEQATAETPSTHEQEVENNAGEHGPQKQDLRVSQSRSVDRARDTLSGTPPSCSECEEVSCSTNERGSTSAAMLPDDWVLSVSSLDSLPSESGQLRASHWAKWWWTEPQT